MYVVDITYSTRAPNTKRIQASIQASMAVRPSALGVLVVTLLKMLTSTRKRVTNRAILPGITSIGIRKDIHETITNSPKQKQFAAIWLVLCLLCLLVIGFTWREIVCNYVSRNISCEHHFKPGQRKIAKRTIVKDRIVWLKRINFWRFYNEIWK